MVGNVYSGQTDGISAKTREIMLFKQVTCCICPIHFIDATNMQTTLIWGLQMYRMETHNLTIQDKFLTQGKD